MTAGARVGPSRAIHPGQARRRETRRLTATSLPVDEATLERASFRHPSRPRKRKTTSAICGRISFSVRTQDERLQGHARRCCLDVVDSRRQGLCSIPAAARTVQSATGLRLEAGARARRRETQRNQGVRGCRSCILAVEASCPCASTRRWSCVMVLSSRRKHRDVAGQVRRQRRAVIARRLLQLPASPLAVLSRRSGGAWIGLQMTQRRREENALAGSERLLRVARHGHIASSICTPLWRALRRDA